MDSTKPVRELLTPYEERIQELGAVAKNYLSLWYGECPNLGGRELYERELNRIDRLVSGKKVDR